MARAGQNRLDIAGLGPDDARGDAHGVEAFGDDDPVLHATPLRALLRDLEQTEGVLGKFVVPSVMRGAAVDPATHRAHPLEVARAILHDRIERIGLAQLRQLGVVDRAPKRARRSGARRVVERERVGAPGALPRSFEHRREPRIGAKRLPLAAFRIRKFQIQRAGQRTRGVRILLERVDREVEFLEGSVVVSLEAPSQGEEHMHPGLGIEGTQLVQRATGVRWPILVQGAHRLLEQHQFARHGRALRGRRRCSVARGRVGRTAPDRCNRCDRERHRHEFGCDIAEARQSSTLAHGFSFRSGIRATSLPSASSIRISGSPVSVTRMTMRSLPSRSASEMPACVGFTPIPIRLTIIFR